MSGKKLVRPNWTFSMTVALAVAACAALVGCLAGIGSDKTDRVYLQNSAGSVLFDHGKHGEAIGSCVSCHHDLNGAEPAVSCTECHDDEMDVDEFDHASHKEMLAGDCAKCHEQVKGNDQAVSCRTCHPGAQPNDNRTPGCIECHDEEYTPDMLTHDEYQEQEEHSCVGCHAPRAVSEAYHSNCSSCHLDSAPKRFADADGNLVCGACHLR